MQSSPALSICIPTYNRLNWLKRALTSITIANSEVSQDIEIIVSDDSSDIACAEVVQEVLRSWSGQWKYVANQPRLGMAENWNHSIQLASGEYVLILHDDDFLLTGAAENILNGISQFREQYPVLLFGTHVVNEKEQILKKQTYKKQRYLPPKTALINLLSNSSFVRFPAIVIERRVFEEVGYFDPTWEEPTDVEMWIRLFSRYGVCCLPFATCAYTIHSQALTMGVFNEKTVSILLEIFEQVSALDILSASQLKICQAKFFHQFILGGAFRKLRRRLFREFHQIMQLFKLPTIKNLNPSTKWWFFRVSFGAIDQIYNIFV